jgi:hypothetical protein
MGEADRRVELLLSHVEAHNRVWGMPGLVPYMTYSSTR